MKIWFIIIKSIIKKIIIDFVFDLFIYNYLIY